MSDLDTDDVNKAIEAIKGKPVEGMTGVAFVPDNPTPDDSEQLRQKLAAIEHERWSDWQKWCHRVIRENVGAHKSLESVLRRWDRQIETPYTELSDGEKASDMEQVDRYWPLIESYVTARVTAELEKLLEHQRSYLFATFTHDELGVPSSVIKDRINNLTQPQAGKGGADEI